MVTAPSFFWNNFTQRVLSQSNNISYAARGIYRVHDTEPNRKGDYWFRDFGMVMACAYLTELGFRATETLNTMPLATEAMNLHKLSELQNPITGAPIYQGARNYSTLPEVVRERVMGTLIRNSADMVPTLMKIKELELRQREELPPRILKMVTEMLESPIESASDQIQNYLRGTGLKLQDIQKISHIENMTRRDDAIKALHLHHPKLKADVIENAVKLEDARQMGILMDHLHKNLNFTEYVKTKYLSDHKLSGSVSEVIRDYADKLTNMQEKGKKEFAEAVQEALQLPIDKREAAFGQRFNEILASLELRKGVPIATDKEYQRLQQLAETTKAALKTDDHKALKAIQKKVSVFYKKLETNYGDHLDNLFENTTQDLRSKIAKKIEAAVESVQNLTPGKGRHAVLAEKLSELHLGTLVPDNTEAIETLRQEIQKLLPDNPHEYVSAGTLKEINKHISNFKNTIPTEPGALLKPFFKQVPSKEEFQRLIMDGLKSKAMSNALNKIQKNGTWPKMAATVLLNLFFYGYLASNFDNKILQPFQKKLVAERGTAQDIVTAGYMGVVPGLAVLTQLVDETALPVFRRMGHFSRFAVVGGAALATFAGSTYAFLMQRLKNAPLNPSSQEPVQQAGPFYRPAGLSFTAGQLPTAPISARPATPFSSFRLPNPNGANNFAVAQSTAQRHTY